jgi:hypothetical protein
MPADKTVATYDAKKVSVIIDGQPLHGFGDGDFIQITTTDRFSKIVGADGEVARGLSNDRTATITITLLQTSKANAVLQSMWEADAEDGTGMKAIEISDGQGESKFHADQAWVTKIPDISYGVGVGTRQWIIATGQAEGKLDRSAY